MDIPDGLQDIAENSTQFTCYPNPFAGEITIEIQNPKRTKVSVEIYNLAGQKIRTLVNGTNDEQLVLKWNGTNDLGQKVKSGICICKVNERSKQIIFEGQKGNK